MSPPAKIQNTAKAKAGGCPNPLSSGLNGEMMDTLGEAGSAYLRGMVSINRELIDFIGKRLDHDAELSRALGQCREWKEAAELQQAWIRDASEEYAENVSKLMRLTTKMMNDTWAPLKKLDAGPFGPTAGTE